MSTSVIVFGATGAVGSAAAQEAAARGAHVWLAMRDPKKTLNWISPEDEKKGPYTRVQADLTDPESIKKAVEASGAKSVFIYVAHGAKGMRPSVQALKDAGVTWVVLLSSFTIRGPVRDVVPRDAIPYEHAIVEISLQDVGISYAALRPGFFASNIFMFCVEGLKKGTCDLYCPDAPQDYIVPSNIGDIAGVLLTQPKPDRQPSDPEVVYILGPKTYTQKEGVERAAAYVNKDAKVNWVSKQEWMDTQTGKGVPLPFVDYIARCLDGESDGNQYPAEFFKVGSESITKYTGKKPITYEEYLESVKPQLSG